MPKPLRILTWHVHGSYLYYLCHIPHKVYLPFKVNRPEGYGGRWGNFRWGDNVHEVPAEAVRSLDVDCILYQSRRNYEVDQYEILSESQMRLPRIYLEHDPPQEHPTNTRHIIDDPSMLLVHVTHFNNLMWDSGRTPTTVIEHGVKTPPDVSYTGEYDRGLAVVNNLTLRGRRTGADAYQEANRQLPLDLAGINSEVAGGLGDIPHYKLPYIESRYRFFFNPIRYTSLGLSVCEAMMLGMPVVAFATTEMPSVIENGRSGYINSNLGRLIDCMKELIDDRSLAHGLGQGAQRHAKERFNIERFVRDWGRVFNLVCGGARV